MWRIELFGGIKAISGHTVVSHFQTRRAACLLAYLAIHRNRTHHREVLAELLWPDEDVDATRDRLRQAIAAIKRALESESAANGFIIKADRAEVGLFEELVETDVELFVETLAVAERETDSTAHLNLLKRAMELYHGELMPGYFDSWVVTERERLAEM